MKFELQEEITMYESPSEGWSFARLGDLIKLRNGAPFRSSEFVSGGLPVLKIANIKTGKISYDGVSYISEATAKLNKAASVRNGDLLITMTGNRYGGGSDSWVGKVAIYHGEDNKFYLNQRLAFIDVVSPRLNKVFLAYYLNTFFVQELLVLSAKGAGGQANLSSDIIKDLRIPLPNLEEQVKVVEILSSLDEKIDLDRAIDANLKKISESLFRYWFVDFEFPGEKDKPYKSSGGRFVNSAIGKIPAGWKVGKLSDISGIAIGRTPPRMQKQWFSRNADDIKWASIRDLSGVEVYITETAEYLTQEAVEKFKIPIIPPNTVIVSFKLTVGRVAITSEKMLSNEAIAHVNLTNGDVTPEYVYLMLKRFDYSSLGSTSSIATAVNSKTIKEMPVLIPDGETLRKFSQIVEPLFKSIYMNSKQISQILQMRRSLVPRLLNGKIRVSSQEAKAVVKKSEAPQPFREAALVADLIANFANPYPLTRYRYTKYSYFVKRYLRQDASKEYAQMPGGPYNPRMRYNGPENILVKKQYARQSGNGFVAGPKMNEILQYAQRYGFASGVNFVRRELAGKTDNELELLSTTDYAMLNLGKKGNQAPGPDDVINEIKSEAVWMPKLAKPHFSREKITRAIQWLRARQLKYGY